MRLGPLVLALGALLAACGFILSMRASHSVVPRDPSEADPVHPVTADMLVQTAERANTLAPNFSLQDAAGHTQTLRSVSSGKPLLLYFILEGCPCSVAAEPFFQRLHKAFGRSVSFAGVIGSGEKAATTWASTNHMQCPILADPTLKTAFAYHADRSAYSALIVNGKVIRMWPGYSVEMLQDAAEEIADAAHVKTPILDTAGAPRKYASGCGFDFAAQGLKR